MEFRYMAPCPRSALLPSILRCKCVAFLVLVYYSVYRYSICVLVDAYRAFDLALFASTSLRAQASESPPTYSTKWIAIIPLPPH
jgi:hypothetical protein